jgi:hypothetical protein
MKEIEDQIKIKFEHDGTKKTKSFKVKSTDYLELLTLLKKDFALSLNQIIIGCFNTKDKLIIIIEEIATNLETYHLCKLMLVVKNIINFSKNNMFFEYTYEIDNLIANDQVNFLVFSPNIEEIKNVDFLAAKKINFYYKIDSELSFGFVTGERMSVDLDIVIVNDLIFKFENDSMLTEYFSKIPILQREFLIYFRNKDVYVSQIFEFEMFRRPAFCAFLQTNFILFYRGLIRFDVFRQRLSNLLSSFFEPHSPNLSTSFSKDINKQDAYNGKLVMSEIQIAQQGKPHSDICLPNSSNGIKTNNNVINVNTLYKSDSRITNTDVDKQRDSSLPAISQKKPYVSVSTKEAINHSNFPQKITHQKVIENEEQKNNPISNELQDKPEDALVIQKQSKSNREISKVLVSSPDPIDNITSPEIQKSTNNSPTHQSNSIVKSSRNFPTSPPASRATVKNLVSSLLKELNFKPSESEVLQKYITDNPDTFSDAIQLYIKTGLTEPLKDIILEKKLMGEFDSQKFILLNSNGNKNLKKSLSLDACRELMNKIFLMKMLPKVVVFEIKHLLLQKSITVLGAFEYAMESNNLEDFAETANLIYEFFYQKNLLHFSTEYSKCIFNYNDFDLLINDQYKIVKKFSDELDDPTILSLKASINSRKLWVYYVYQNYCRDNNFERFIENLKKINESRSAKYSAKDNSCINICRFLSEQKEYKEKLDLIRKITADPQLDLKFSLFEYQIIMKDPSLSGIIELYNCNKERDDLIENLKIYQKIVRDEIPLGTIINVLIKNNFKEHQVSLKDSSL